MERNTLGGRRERGAGERESLLPPVFGGAGIDLTHLGAAYAAVAMVARSSDLTETILFCSWLGYSKIVYMTLKLPEQVLSKRKYDPKKGK